MWSAERYNGYEIDSEYGVETKTDIDIYVFHHITAQSSVLTWGVVFVGSVYGERVYTVNVWEYLMLL
jgi:hypothetical protein